MLKKLRVDNFRSLVNFEFTPTGMNLLVGPNNAGKTNLCSALRFLSLSASTPLENAALMTFGETWNIRNVYVDAFEMTLEISCELQYDGQLLDYSYRLLLQAPKKGELSAPPLRLLEESLTVSGGVFKDTQLLGNNRGQARMLHEQGFVGHFAGSPYYVETLARDDATMLSQLYELKDNPRATFFKRYLRSWLYFNFVPDALRAPEVLRDQRFLRHDGANLNRVLFDMHNEKPRLERKLILALKTLEPKLDLFSFSSPDPEHIYLFLEDEKGNRFGTRSASDGTMRFLGITCVILTAEEAVTDKFPPPLIVLEEPENGLYVGQLKPLIERIDPLCSNGQFVFTSHSPYFMDLFDGQLEGVNLIKPGVPSSTIARINTDKIRGLLKEMSLGEMHFRELLA